MVGREQLGQLVNAWLGGWAAFAWHYELSSCRRHFPPARPSCCRPTPSSSLRLCGPAHPGRVGQAVAVWADGRPEERRPAGVARRQRGRGPRLSADRPLCVPRPGHQVVRGPGAAGCGRGDVCVCACVLCESARDGGRCGRSSGPHPWVLCLPPVPPTCAPHTALPAGPSGHSTQWAARACPHDARARCIHASSKLSHPVATTTHEQLPLSD